MNKLINLFPSKAFIFFFILMLVSDSIWALASPLLPSIGLKLVILSGLWAALFSFPAMIMHNPSLRHSYYGVITAIILAFIIVDYFSWFNFNMIIDWAMLDLIANTTGNEASGFFSSYLNISSITIVVLAVAALVTIAWFAGKFLGKFKKTMAIIAAVITLWGIGIYGTTVYDYVKYRNGESVPRLVSFTRLAYSIIKQEQRAKLLEQIRIINDNEVAAQASVQPDSTIIVLIIGESHSLFHTQAKGYDKNTNPLLSKRLAGPDSLRTITFNDAISSNDRTDFVMEAIFTVGGPTAYAQKPMFPAVFKRNGFKTVLLDNEFGVGQGASFMLDPHLNETIYDVRNPNVLKLDEDLISALPDSIDAPALIIFHLMGSHFNYGDRYNHNQFEHFTTADYDYNRYTEAQRTTIAHYDNSLLYTDFVVDNIINQFADKNAVVIYFSDHGEEVFELRNYAGHSCAANSPDPQYQIRIPMFIWMSESYAESHPEQLKALHNNKNKPVITDDTAQLLFSLAGISDTLTDSTHSVASPHYNPSPRIILNSLPFD